MVETKVVVKEGYEEIYQLAVAKLENLETDDHMLELEGSTPEKFTLAYESLKKIVDKIEG